MGHASDLTARPWAVTHALSGHHGFTMPGPRRDGGLSVADELAAAHETSAAAESAAAAVAQISALQGRVGELTAQLRVVEEERARDAAEVVLHSAAELQTAVGRIVTVEAERDAAYQQAHEHVAGVQALQDIVTQLRMERDACLVDQLGTAQEVTALHGQLREAEAARLRAEVEAAAAVERVAREGRAHGEALAALSAMHSAQREEDLAALATVRLFLLFDSAAIVNPQS